MHQSVYVCLAVYFLRMDQCMYVWRCTPYVWTSVCMFGGVLPMYGPVYVWWCTPYVWISVCMLDGVLPKYGPVYVWRCAPYVWISVCLAVYFLCMDQCMYVRWCTTYVWTSVCLEVYSLCMDQCMLDGVLPMYGQCMFGGVLPMYGAVYCMLDGVLPMYGAVYVWRCTSYVWTSVCLAVYSLCVCEIPGYMAFPRYPFIINISMYFGATEKWHVQMVMVSRVVQLARASDSSSGTRVSNRPVCGVILVIADV